MSAKEHYCRKHHSSYGYLDADGEWNCWRCYKEDKYRYPEGTIRDFYTVNNYEARLMFIGSHNVRIEIWFIKGNVPSLVFSNVYNYLSVAGRDWSKLTRKMESGERF